jgi:hypothetical protein
LKGSVYVDAERRAGTTTLAEPDPRRLALAGIRVFEYKEAGGREISPDVPGDMDAPTTPLRHDARERHDKSLG